jgi:hypothetical protein
MGRDTDEKGLVLLLSLATAVPLTSLRTTFSSSFFVWPDLTTPKIRDRGKDRLHGEHGACLDSLGRLSILHS